MTSAVVTPFAVFADRSGAPLDSGYVYIGTANQNPQTTPISIYWDADGLVPASQPLRTSGGYIWRNGTPANVYAGVNTFSITVRDSNETLVYSVPSATTNDNISGRNIYVSTVGGTADVITLTPVPAISAYVAGQVFSWIASGTNTTNVTVAVSGLTAKALTKNGSVALAAGDVPSGAMIVAEYDGTRFQLLSKNSIDKSVVTAKGDLIGGTAAQTVARLAIGNDYQFLRGLASASTGLSWLGMLPTENVGASVVLTAAQMNKGLISATNASTYTLPDLTTALDGSVVLLACNAALATGITLAADASDSILDPTTGTVGSITVNGTGESIALVGCKANDRWYVLALNRTQQRAVMQFDSGTSTVTAGSTAYFGNSNATATEVAHDIRVPFKCVIANLFGTPQAAQTGGQTTTYTVRKNAADTAVTCINSSGRTASDTINTVAFAQGDLLSIKIVTSAGATVTTHTASVELRRVT